MDLAHQRRSLPRQFHRFTLPSRGVGMGATCGGGLVQSVPGTVDVEDYARTAPCLLASSAPPASLAWLLPGPLTMSFEALPLDPLAAQVLAALGVARVGEGKTCGPAVNVRGSGGALQQSSSGLW